MIVAWDFLINNVICFNWFDLIIIWETLVINVIISLIKTAAQIRATCNDGTTVVESADTEQDLVCGSLGGSLDPKPCAAPCQVRNL